MANVNGAYGLRPSRHLKGGTIRMSEYSIASELAADIKCGDPVELTGTGRNITLAAADNADSIGVFMGCNYVDSTGSHKFSKQWVSGQVGTEAVAHVCDDPDVVFTGQATTIAEGDIGQLADWDGSAGNASTGISGNQIDGTSYGATGGALRVLGLVKEPGNDYGAYAKVEVVFAEHVLSNVVSGVGGV
jgi:hypothetical protein